jgi:kynurenine formamidase
MCVSGPAGTSSPGGRHGEKVCGAITTSVQRHAASEGPWRREVLGGPVHVRLSGYDILVIEKQELGLKEVLGKRVTVAAAPFRIKEGDASPIAPLTMID